jgi:DNA-binding GntR family transcriptional regulator
VYELLRDAIVAAELEPGQRLSENELAALLKVSRTPVREALVRLVDDRLVEIAPQLGTFVTPISVAAERAGREDLAALEGLIVQQRHVATAKAYDRFYTLDDEFHAALAGIAAKPIAWTLAQRANSHLNRLRRLTLPRGKHLDAVIVAHRQIVRAVRRGDPAEAESRMREHLRGVLAVLPAIRDEHPTYFDDR